MVTEMPTRTNLTINRLDVMAEALSQWSTDCHANGDLYSNEYLQTISDAEAWVYAQIRKRSKKGGLI